MRLAVDDLRLCGGIGGGCFRGRCAVRGAVTAAAGSQTQNQNQGHYQCKKLLHRINLLSRLDTNMNHTLSVLTQTAGNTVACHLQ